MDSERYKRIYSHVYSTNERYGAGHGQGALALLAALLPPHGRVVDCGCGRNQFGASLRSVRPDVTVIGIDVVRVDPVPPGIEFRQGHMGDLRVVPEPVDVVVSFDALEHLYPEDVRPTVTAWARRASVGVFSIASQDSINRGPEGVTLHPTVRRVEWWNRMLKSTFGRVQHHRGYYVAYRAAEHAMVTRVIESLRANMV